MRAYETVWLLFAAAVTGLAGLTMVTTAGWGSTIATVVAVALLAGVLAFSWRESFGPASLSVVRWTAGSSAGALMFVGLPLAVGRASFLVFAGLALTSPSLVRRLGRRLGRRLATGTPRTEVARDVPRTPGTGAAPAPGMDPLSTHAWLDTTFRLRDAATPEEALVVVQERARLLDDLEQRDPHAFREWLTSAVA